MVRQGAMAARDTELAELFETCHEETWNQLKWIKTKIKEAPAQVLVGDEDDQLAMAGRCTDGLCALSTQFAGGDRVTHAGPPSTPPVSFTGSLPDERKRKRVHAARACRDGLARR